jgi:hypothetical protein
LEAVEQADTFLGELTLLIARRLCETRSASGVASLSKELRAVYAAAIDGATSSKSDAVDELKKRRAAKQASARKGVCADA